MDEATQKAVSAFFGIEEGGMGDGSLTFLLVMDQLPSLDPEAMRKTIEAYEPIDGEVDVQIMDAKSCAGSARFGSHRFRWIGIDAPLPTETYEEPMQVSHMEDALKAKFASHSSHVMLWYTGEETDPMERYIAMYKVVDAIADDGFCGLINSTANVLNGAIVPQAIREHLLQMREGMPPLMLVNVVMMFKDDGSAWYVSNGNGVFGVPEFAYLGAQGQLETVVGLFQMFLWETYRSGRQLSLGDRLDASGISFELIELYEYEQYIRGGTDDPYYVLQPSNAPARGGSMSGSPAGRGGGDAGARSTRATMSRRNKKKSGCAGMVLGLALVVGAGLVLLLSR